MTFDLSEFQRVKPFGQANEGSALIMCSNLSNRRNSTVRANYDSTIIRWSISNRFLVLVKPLSPPSYLAVCWSVKKYTCRCHLILVDVQVIIKTSYPAVPQGRWGSGWSHPLHHPAMLNRVLKQFATRSQDSYAFETSLNDDTDVVPSAVHAALEYQAKLQPNPVIWGAKPTLGPDATGVGFSHVLGQDKPGQATPAKPRSLQDWSLKYELQTRRRVWSEGPLRYSRRKQAQIDPAGYKLATSITSKLPQGQGTKMVTKKTGASVVEIMEAVNMVHDRFTGDTSKTFNLCR